MIVQWYFMSYFIDLPKTIYFIKMSICPKKKKEKKHVNLVQFNATNVE